MVHSEGFPHCNPVAEGSWSSWQPGTTLRDCARGRRILPHMDAMGKQ